jgi:hypothetical protein
MLEGKWRKMREEKRNKENYALMMEGSDETSRC